MAATIKIKRSATAAGAPASLKSGELAYTFTGGVDKLYFGKGDDGSGNATSIVQIGGEYYTNLLSATAGTVTASKALIVDSNSKLDILNVDNITLNGNTISSTDSNGNLIFSPNGTGKVSFYNAYTFPTTLGTAGYALVSDGAGGLTWAGVNTANTATNLSGGTAGQVPYQSAPGVTEFYGPGTAGQILVSAGTSAPTYTSTSSIYVNSAINAETLRGGTTGQLVYQSSADTTGFVGPGTSGQLLVSAGAGAPVYTNTSSIYVQDANVSTNVRSGTAGQLVYQSSADTTGFVGPGTAGQILVSAGTSSPTYTSTSSIYVNSSVNAETLRGGSQGQILYQSAADTTAFVNSGTTGQFLQAITNGTPTFTSTGSIYVNSSVNAETLRGGTTGQLVYQSSAGTTGFVGPGTSGQLLVSAGTSAPVYTNTGSIYVYRATTADATLASVTFDNSNTGVASGTTFNGSVNRTVSANTIGALSLSGGGVVSGDVTFSGPVTFSGTATYSLSTNTYYTDNILEIHVPPGGIGSTWSTDDGKDIGLRFHYYGGDDKNSFLGLANDTKYLEWYETGSEDAQGVFTGTTSYGTFKTGAVIAGSRLIVGSFSNSTATQSGEALTVSGGLYVTGVATATTFIGALTGTATQANNINNGTTGQLVYQSAANTTGFVGPGTSGQLLVSAGTSAPVYTNTSSIYVNSSVNAETLRGGTTGQLVYQSSADTTGFVGPGTSGQLLVSAGTSAPVYTNTGSIYVQNATISTNIRAGATGSIPYQSGASATTFLDIGTNGYVLTSNGTVPIWAGLSGLSAGNSTTATNLAGGTAGQVPYQTASGSTSFYGPGTAGQLLVSAGTSAPTYTSTSSIYVNSSVNAETLRGGTTGQLVYQSSADTTGFVGPGTSGQLLVSAGAGAPTYTSTSSIYVNSSVNAETLRGGTTGQLVYQSSADTTGFVGPGTYGQFLMSTGASSPVYQSTLTSVGSSILVTGDSASINTTSGALQIVNGGLGVGGGGYFGGIVTATNFVGSLVGTASSANNLTGGAGGSLPYQSGAGVTVYLPAGTAGQILQISTATSLPVWGDIDGGTY